ncbi:MAG TPA: hypothetical protein VL202_16685 [Pararhizobium sp.]|uniref:hypothetical protein n=1 Tax=Pararhizobium sp. TaxID=1977563 RepID=UPI002B819522|nr:hypothetical protein [Pararhizobium sp.]HTO32796.1 hypothetical protein [Pararhizobium sp.]
MAQAHPFDTSSNASLSDAEVLDQAEVLVDEFLAFIRREEIWNDILDVNILPASKSTLVNAFRLVIATESRPDYRRQLAKAGLMLARFHRDVGPRMSLIPIRPDDASPHADPEMNAREQQAYLDRFDAAYSLIGPDLTQLGSLFEASMRLAARRDMRRHAQHDASGSDGTCIWYGPH